jgi:hypothetical protein
MIRLILPVGRQLPIPASQVALELRQPGRVTVGLTLDAAVDLDRGILVKKNQHLFHLLIVTRGVKAARRCNIPTVWNHSRLFAFIRGLMRLPG